MISHLNFMGNFLLMLRLTASMPVWPNCYQIHFRRDPSQVLNLESFLSTRYAQSSLMQIARFLLRARGMSRNPTAVLTFNADVLLHVALTLLQLRESSSSSGSLSPDFHYRALYHSTDRPNGKIPIYHIHGSITPESGHRESRDKLVFPESSYSQLAASVYAWPQTVFLSNAQASRMVFVGLSMSDPNIRRWLSWCEGYRRSDVSQIRVLEIDEVAGCVKVDNDGTVMTLVLALSPTPRSPPDLPPLPVQTMSRR